jgi:hypothetical protein
MRCQSLRALANLLAAPASPAITSGSARWSRHEGWGRCGYNNLNRPVGGMLIGGPSDTPRKMRVTCGV